MPSITRNSDSPIAAARPYSGGYDKVACQIAVVTT